MRKNNQSLIDGLFNLLQTSIELFVDIFNLVILELKLSAKNLLTVCGLLILILVMAITSWMCFLAAISFYLINLGLEAVMIFLILGCINLLPILPLVFIIRYYVQYIGIPATTRQLTRPEKT